MVITNAAVLQDMLWTMEAMQELMDLEESQPRRSYVREEHVPFLESRFRNFDSYITTHNPENFAHFARLSPCEFQDLFERLGPHLQHEPFHATPINGQRRLFVNLRFVGHGYAYGALAEELNIGKQTVSHIVFEVTDAINTVLFAEAFPPLTREALEDCSFKTQQRYDYPRAVGFMDGKHIVIRKPRNAGNTYWNYKGFHSIILLAVCDCDYRFIAYDVGAPGRAGDAGVFQNSGIRTFFDERDEVFPVTAALNDVGPVQYHILVDGGFAQGHRYIRPIAEPSATTASKRRFNGKLSGSGIKNLDFSHVPYSSFPLASARRMIESSFGILCKRFGISQRDLNVEPEKAAKLVASLVILRNLLARRQDLLEQVERFLPLRNTPLLDLFAPLQRTARHGGSDSAKLARDRLVRYYDDLYRPVPAL